MEVGTSAEFSKLKVDVFLVGCRMKVLASERINIRFWLTRAADVAMGLGADRPKRGIMAQTPQAG